MPTDLMTAFDFTNEDLLHNRTGDLSPRQQQAQKKYSGKNRVQMAVAGLVFGVAGIVLLLPFIRTFSPDAAPIWRIVVGGASIAVGLFFGSGIFDKYTIKIEETEGRAQFLRRESSSTDADGTTSSSTTNLLVIGGFEFPVKLAQYDALNQGHVYKAYFSRAPYQIWSIEYIGPPPEAE